MVCHHFLSYMSATIGQVCGKAENFKLQTLISIRNISESDLGLVYVIIP